MATEEEDLDVNPFYLLLQNRYLQSYNTAQENCYTICIPEAKNLHGCVLNRTFLETHILKPSPFFADQYLTTCRNPKTVVLENVTITLQEDLYERKVKVVSQELGYNKELKPFKILIIDRPLVQRNMSIVPDEAPTKSEFCTVRRSLAESKKFLYSFHENKEILEKLERDIKTFNTNYMVLPDYLDDAARKIQNIVSQAKQGLTALYQYSRQVDRQVLESMHIAVESYVLASVHSHIYPVICVKCATDDDLMTDRCHNLTGLTGDQLGLREEFACSLPAAVVELATLDGLHTPLEKLFCLKTTLDKITEGINKNMQESPSPAGFTPPCLTSDDLIPILVTVIIHSKNKHLCSTISLIEKFHWCSSYKDDLSFSFVTFKAAVEFMKSNDFSQVKPTRSQNLKEIPIDDLVQRSASLEIEDDTTRGRSSSTPGHTGASRLQRQLASVSKILEQSDDLVESKPTYLGQRRHSSNIPDVIPVRDRPRQNLGGFLSSLQNDMFSSHGRKS